MCDDVTMVKTVPALVALCVMAGGAGPAADPVLHFVVPPPLASGLAAMPQIANPANDAQRRINAATQRLDATVRKAAAACKTDDGKPGDWERSIAVTMRGPGFVSFVITESTYCGGPHPNTGTMSIVYDLQTGRPVDWTKLLPPSLTGTVALEPQMDGSRIVTLASKRLYALYVAGYRTDGTPDDQAQCKDAIQGDDAPPMMAWLDAKAGGLAVQFDLPHAMAACEQPVVIPAATLRSEGAKPALLDAFSARQ